MKYISVISGLAIFTLWGCQGEKEIAILGSGVPVAYAVSKNPADHSSPAMRKSKEYWSRYDRANEMSYDPAKYTEAVEELNNLLAEKPKNALALKSLGHLYFAHDQNEKSAKCFHKLLDDLNNDLYTINVNPNDWYVMYLVFKEIGEEEDSRKALVQAIEGQKIDPSITYTNIRQAPPVEAIRLGEMEAVSWLRSGSQHKKAIVMAVDLADKDGLTPKMMTAISLGLRLDGHEQKGVELLKRVYEMDTPEANKLKPRIKGDLIQYGVLKPDPITGSGVNLPIDEATRKQMLGQN